jgi:hypothetical protein
MQNEIFAIRVLQIVDLTNNATKWVNCEQTFLLRQYKELLLNMKYNVYGVFY